MSLRRKSCDTCFKGRRKCDLGYPVCGRCVKNGKECHYVYMPVNGVIRGTSEPECNPTATEQPIPVSTIEELLELENCLGENIELYDTQDPVLGYSEYSSSEELRSTRSVSIPNLLGDYGEVQPVEGANESWQWVMDQMKSYPRTFAQRAETAFIHRQLYRHATPQPMRAAFAVCTAYACKNQSNQTMFFRLLESEVSTLLRPALGGRLLEDLSKLQALLFYQSIRLFEGDVRQRVIAEQQQDIVGEWALQLQSRATAEIGGAKLTWEKWMLAECIRRTVLMAFLLQGIYSVFKLGFCDVIQTLRELPVSTLAGRWDSSGVVGQIVDKDDTVTYFQYTDLWLACPPPQLEPFKKVLVVACKGLEKTEALSPSLLTLSV